MDQVPRIKHGLKHTCSAWRGSLHCKACDAGIPVPPMPKHVRETVEAVMQLHEEEQRTSQKQRASEALVEHENDGNDHCRWCGMNLQAAHPLRCPKRPTVLVEAAEALGRVRAWAEKAAARVGDSKVKVIQRDCEAVLRGLVSCTNEASTSLYDTAKRVVNEWDGMDSEALNRAMVALALLIEENPRPDNPVPYWDDELRKVLAYIEDSEEHDVRGVFRALKRLAHRSPDDARSETALPEEKKP